MDGPIVSRRTLLLAVPAAVVLSSGLFGSSAGATTTAEAQPGAALARRSGALAIRGADISFTLQEYQAGKRFSDHGRVRQVEEILVDHGANYARLRLWVNPPPGYSNLETTLAMAGRARRAGMKILLDLHYSDFWADPGHQTIPAAWQSQDLATLTKTVHDYTRTVIQTFARHGTPVDMVQIGNEITAGMLWPLGQIYLDPNAPNWADFATLLNAGIAGARAGNPRSQQLRIMVHIDRGGDNGGSTWFFDHAMAAGVTDFDVIGESYYPFWHGPLAALEANLNDLAPRYGKDIIVAETAYPWTLQDGDDLANSLTDASQLPDETAYPPTPAGQAAYFEALRNVLLQVPNNRGVGFFDWEPEWIPGVGWEPGQGNPNDNLTMFDFNGAALPSLQAFRPPGAPSPHS
jgi:arabinogalactan endo-1,4-beta-galactosidase